MPLPRLTRSHATRFFDFFGHRVLEPDLPGIFVLGPDMRHERDVERRVVVYALPLELGQDEVVARHVARAVESIAEALERLPGRLRVPATEAAALVAATVQEPVRALVLGGATPDASARLARALSTMIAAYVADVVDAP